MDSVVLKSRNLMAQNHYSNGSPDAILKSFAQSHNLKLLPIAAAPGPACPF
jgi:hypothetical protein